MKLVLLLSVFLTLQSAFAQSCKESCSRDYKGCLQDVRLDATKIKASISSMQIEDAQVLKNLKDYYAEMEKNAVLECAEEKDDCLKECR